MKKLNYCHPQVHTRLLKVLTPVSLLGMCLSGTLLAADNTWEIQSGNSLSKIVAEKYPDYGNRQVIMREILKRNPQAFRSENINSLIVGKTLQLPDPADIPDLQPPAPKPAEGIDPALQEKLQALETKVSELEETITILEEENTALQEMVNEAAAGKSSTAESAATPTPPVDNTLQQRLDEAEKALAASKTTSTTLEAQLTAVQRENEILQNDLQQIRAAAAVAETKAAGSGNLPWILLGLLALLTLPLLWLLRRKREPVPAPVASAVTAESATMPVAASPAVMVDSSAGGGIIPLADENPDAALKLDIARAYLDLRDAEGAADILQDVLVEGSEQQRQEAREILSFIT